MFVTGFYNRIAFSNPFMLGCNPRMDFYMGMALATSGLQSYMPVGGYIPMCGCGSAYYQMYPQYQTPVLTNFSTGSSVYNPILNTNYNFDYSSSSTQFNYTPYSFSFPTLSFNPPTINYTASSSSVRSQGAVNPASRVDASSISTNGKLLSGKGKDSQYGPDFLAKVKQIAKNINCDYKDLLGVMDSESGISSTVTHKNSGATGLIQFMPSVAARLGTSSERLKNMSPLQQLDYVEKYIKDAKKMAGFGEKEHISGGQLYALIFLPARAKNEELTSSSEKYYAANTALDTNRDGKITKTELDNRVKSHYVSDNTFLA